MAARRHPGLTSVIVPLIVAIGMVLLLGGCGGAPKPSATPATPTPVRPVLTWTATASPAAVVAATKPAATATQAATRTPSPMPSPTATPQPAPSATPTVVPTTATNTPAPTATATVTATPTSRPAATRLAATATPTTVPLKERVWDARLTLRGAVLIPAQVQPGQGYWRLVQAQWFDVEDAPFAGKHHIFVDALDQAGNRQVGVPIRLASSDGKTVYGYAGTEAKPGEPYAASFPMSAIAPAYRVEPADGAPADAVTGLGLGNIEFPNLAMLTSYGFTWQWTVQGAASAGPTPAAAGSGPENALTVSGASRRLAMGQRIWYAFGYAGDLSQVVVEMQVTPPGAASFVVWTPAQAKQWAQGNAGKPVGTGTPNEGAGGALVWAGSFNASGIYYIMVEQTGPYAGSFVLTIAGTGVSPAGVGE